MKNIAIIPARSGAKGLKNKNIRDLYGKALMAYTIEASIESGEFEEVMISKDSEKYAESARQYGANVPFLRSTMTSSDTASSWNMVEEVLKGYKQCGREFDTFCLLQPTSPLRSVDDITSTYQLHRQKAEFAVVSVCEAEHSSLWCGNLPKNGEFIGFVMSQKTSVDIDTEMDFKLAEILWRGYYLRYYYPGLLGTLLSTLEPRRRCA